jgi:hypothetical protein
VIDEDASHGFGGGAVEVPAPVEGHLLQALEPEIRLAYELGGLERVIRALVPQQVAREPAELVVHDAEQLFEGSRITAVPAIEEKGDITHIGGDCRSYRST